MPIVERQQLLLVEFDLIELVMRLVHVLGAGDDELLGRSDFFEAEDVAAQVQTHLAPMPDRQHRHLDLAEPFERGALAPPVVVERVLGDGADEIEAHRRTSRSAGGAMLVVGAQVGVPG